MIEHMHGGLPNATDKPWAEHLGAASLFVPPDSACQSFHTMPSRRAMLSEPSLPRRHATERHAQDSHQQPSALVSASHPADVSLLYPFQGRMKRSADSGPRSISFTRHGSPLGGRNGQPSCTQLRTHMRSIFLSQHGSLCIGTQDFCIRSRPRRLGFERSVSATIRFDSLLRDSELGRAICRLCLVMSPTRSSLVESERRAPAPRRGQSSGSH